MQYIAIDPAKDTLECYDGTQIFKVPNSEKGWSRIAQYREVYIEGALTYTQNLVDFLKSRGIQVYSVSPYKNAKMREIISQNKTDSIDAISVFSMIQFSKAHKTSTSKIHIKILADLYISLKKEQAKLRQRLHNLLFIAWGKDYKKIFSKNLEAQWIYKFLLRHPIPDDTYFEDLPPRKKALQDIHIPNSLFISNLKDTIITIVKMLLTYKTQLENIEKQLREIVNKENPELLTFPYMPIALAALLSAYIDSEKFKSKDDFLAYIGLAPRIVQTGKQPTFFRKRIRYNKKIQSKIFMLTLINIKSNPQTRAFFEKKKKEKPQGRAAFWATARQIAKILFHMMQKREPYNPKFSPLKKD